MILMHQLLTGRTIEDVHSDSEVTYLTLADGTLITVHGVIVVEPRGLQTSSPHTDRVDYTSVKPVCGDHGTLSSSGAI